MTNNFENHKIVQLYTESKYKMLKSVFPKASDEDIYEYISSQVNETFYAPKCVLDNNYSGNVINTNLAKIVDWIDKKNPITTEHGVMFKRHDESINLNANLLKLLIDSRKIEKNLMFECIESGDKIGENVHDTKQKIYKIIANS